MACCCSGCVCTEKQWQITISNYVDGRSNNACLNGTYVFPFSGGSIFLCEGYLFSDPNVRWQRCLEVTAFNCGTDSFNLIIDIGTNARWIVGNPGFPLPANYGSFARPNGYRGWRLEPRNGGSLSCSAAINVSGTLSGDPSLPTSSSLGEPFGFRAALGNQFWIFASREGPTIFDPPLPPGQVNIQLV